MKEYPPPTQHIEEETRQMETVLQRMAREARGRFLLTVFEEENWNVLAVEKRLNIYRSQLYHEIRKSPRLHLCLLQARIAQLQKKIAKIKTTTPLDTKHAVKKEKCA